MSRQMRWICRGLIVLLAGAAPWLMGVPFTALALLLLPIAAEMLRVRGEGWCAGIAAAVLTVSCHYLPGMPTLAKVGALCWGGAVLLSLAQQRRSPLHEGVFWLGTSAGIYVCILFYLSRQHPGDLAENLAWIIVERIAAREDGAAVLLSAYRAGLVQLEGELALLPALEAFGTIHMVDEVRLQLMYGLRTVLADFLRVMLPRLAVWGPGAFGVTMALLAGRQASLRGHRSGAPFERWLVPQSMTGYLLALAGLSLVPFVWQSPVTDLAADLAVAALSFVFTVQGLAAMTWLMKRGGLSRSARGLWMAACLVFAGFVPVILGAADQMLDLRRLRRSYDDEGGY